MSNQAQDETDKTPFKIYPIKQVDVYREVLRQLDTLVTETMAPGARLASERELAEQLGVSRISVREALRALESMGKIEMRRNTGSYVLDPSGNPLYPALRAVHDVDTEFLEHLVDVRSAIEVKVVGAVAAIDGPDLSDARAIVENAERELDGGTGELGQLDVRFEAALARVLPNPLLAKMQHLVHQTWILAWSEVGLAPGVARENVDQHRAILEAVEAGDVEEAKRLMSAHVDHSVKTAVAASTSSGSQAGL